MFIDQLIISGHSLTHDPAAPTLLPMLGSSPPINQYDSDVEKYQIQIRNASSAPSSEDEYEQQWLMESGRTRAYDVLEATDWRKVRSKPSKSKAPTAEQASRYENSMVDGGTLVDVNAHTARSTSI